MFLFAVIFSVLPMMAQKSSKSKEEKTVYMMGVSVSMTDSVVYFTEIMPVEGATIDEGTGFLVYHNYYSTELSDYMNLQEICLAGHLRYTIPTSARSWRRKRRN